MRNSKKRLGIWAIVVSAILMIPFLRQAPWTAGDYIFASIVLFGSATVYELVAENLSNKNHRMVLGILFLAGLVFIWGWAVAGP